MFAGSYILNIDKDNCIFKFLVLVLLIYYRSMSDHSLVICGIEIQGNSNSII